MTIHLNAWLTAFQVSFILWMIRDLWKQHQWRKRCNYWRDLTIREYEMYSRSMDRGDMEAAQRHAKAQAEYAKEWLHHLRK